MPQVQFTTISYLGGNYIYKWGQGEYGRLVRGSLCCWEVTLMAP